MKKKVVGRTMVKTSKSASNVCVLRNKQLAYSNSKLSEKTIRGLKNGTNNRKKKDN